MGKPKPGKYEHIVDKYPDLPVEDPSHQEKVDAFKLKVLAAEVHNPESLGLAYAKLRDGIGNPIDDDFRETLLELLGDEGIAALKKECDLRLEAYEQMLYVSYNADEPGWGMYGAGDNTVRLPGGGSVSVQREPTGKVKNKEDFRQWCIKDGLETQLQLWPSTMNAIVKRKALAGEEPPDGVEIYTVRKVVYRHG